MNISFCTPLNLNPLNFVKSPKLMRTNGIRIRASTVESYGSPDYVERMERAWLISQKNVHLNLTPLHQPFPYQGSNPSLLLVLPAPQRDMLSANGATQQVSSYLVITCCVKFLPKTLLVLSVQERVLHAVLIVKEPVIVQNGLQNLQLPSRGVV